MPLGVEMDWSERESVHEVEAGALGCSVSRIDIGGPEGTEKGGVLHGRPYCFR
jgi:hypothetical protein